MSAGCRGRQASTRGPTFCAGSSASQFSKWSDDAWVAFARRTFKEAGDRIVPDYDPQARDNLRDVNFNHPLPALWKEFDALAGVPVMVIRGGNSDILSAQTVEAMRRRRTGSMWWMWRTKVMLRH